MASEGKHVIKDDDHVLLAKAGGSLKLVQVHRKRDIWLDRTKFCMDGTIGHPFGTKFEVKNGQMVKMDKSKEVDGDKPQLGVDTEKDNRFLLDSDSNQKLTRDDIDQLKKEGVIGEKLIEQLIENSTTFETKTEYAQEKWVKKKKKKHLQEFTVLKPTSRLLCEMYWSKGPTRICNLRVDSLAQILTRGNVRAGSTVMVVDTCLGLVTGAVLERLAGFGKVISFYHGDSPMSSPLEAYDFPQEVVDSLHYFPLEQVNSLKHECMQDDKFSQECPEKIVSRVASGAAATEDCNELQRMEDDSSPQASLAENPAQSAEDQTGCLIKSNDSSCGQTASPPKTDTEYTETSCDTSSVQTGKATDSHLKQTGTDDSVQSQVSTDKSESHIEQDGKSGKWKKKGKDKRKPMSRDRRIAKEERAKRITIARNLLLQKNIDCLIVACKFHPSPIVTALHDLMAPSRQLVVFSQFLEAVEDCYACLREHGGVVNFNVTETWLRQYQVLPNRTHPVIQMSGTGGYILTATTTVKQP